LIAMILATAWVVVYWLCPRQKAVNRAFMTYTDAQGRQHTAASAPVTVEWRISLLVTLDKAGDRLVLTPTSKPGSLRITGWTCTWKFADERKGEGRNEWTSGSRQSTGP
jgi:hypothetical protein